MVSRGSHLFKKGVKPPGNGRPKGAPNKTTSLLKHAILAAADCVGRPKWDRKNKKWAYGEGGLQGYLEWLALVEPKAFSTLLGRVLPLQITGEGGGPVRIIDESMSPQQAAQTYAEMLKSHPAPLIDITPERSQISGGLPRLRPQKAIAG